MATVAAPPADQTRPRPRERVPQPAQRLRDLLTTVAGSAGVPAAGLEAGRELGPA